MNVPTGKDFYKLIKIRFADCLDNIDNFTDLSSNKAIGIKDPVKRLSNPDILGRVLIGLFSFYAGRILEDGEETGLYLGPAQHRIHTILNQYVNNACILATLDPAKDIQGLDKLGIDDCLKEAYKELNSVGCSKQRAKEILNKEN